MTPSTEAMPYSVSTVGFPRPASSSASVARATPDARASPAADRPRAARSRRTLAAIVLTESSMTV